MENMEPVISEGQFNIQYTSRYFLAIDDYNISKRDLFTVIFPQSTFDSNIIAEITRDNMFNNDSTTLSIMSAKKIYNGPIDIQKLSFSIYDTYCNILDLNNMDYNIVLKLECLE